MAKIAFDVSPTGHVIAQREVIKLTTSVWKSGRTACIQRKITWVRRKSFGFQILENDFDAIGSAEAVEQIINLNESPDGLYTIEVVNETRDFESGYVDGYDLKLVPYVEGTQ